MPRPGFVLEVDRSTPPTLIWHGEGFRLERLPAGSRVIYPPEPLAPLDDPDGAIRQALLDPLGDSAPLPELLRAGMRLTIAFDDISLPLPPMQSPDIRQRVIEAVLDLAAEAGVDDVVLIAALALHRRMTEPELRHALGRPGLRRLRARTAGCWQHDAEDPANLVHLGLTEQGEDVEINRRAAESDLLVYVNINLVAMDGGHKSVATGLASLPQPPPPPQRPDHAAQPVVHGPAPLRAALAPTGGWAGSSRRAASRCSRSRRRSTPTPSRARSASSRSASGSGALRDRAAFLAVSKALDRTPGLGVAGRSSSRSAPRTR